MHNEPRNASLRAILEMLRLDSDTAIQDGSACVTPPPTNTAPDMGSHEEEEPIFQVPFQRCHVSGREGNPVKFVHGCGV